jgi:hypothetical protein
VVEDALEPLLSSEILVVTMEFKGDDLSEEDWRASVFLNEERRSDDSDDRDRRSWLNRMLRFSSSADALILRLSAILCTAVRSIDFLDGESLLLEI